MRIGITEVILIIILAVALLKPANLPEYIDFIKKILGQATGAWKSMGEAIKAEETAKYETTEAVKNIVSMPDIASIIQPEVVLNQSEVMPSQTETVLSQTEVVSGSKAFTSVIKPSASILEREAALDRMLEGMS